MLNTTFILLLFTIIYPYMLEVENIVEEEEKEGYVEGEARDV